MRGLIFILFTIISFSSQSQTVFKTPSGKKYHLASCRMVENVSQEITVEEARKAGLQPCLICKPTDIYSGSSNVHKAQGQSKKTTQCKALTKNRTRCKHMTSIANGYCYQHQPK